MFGFWKTWKALEARGIMGINRRNADYVLKYNKRSLYPIVDDKILTKERAIAAGIHVPELYGVISTEKEIDKLGDIIGERSDFVIKPAQGAGGDGIIVVADRFEGRFRTVSGKIISHEEIEHHISSILTGLYSLGGHRDRALIEYRVMPGPDLQEHQLRRRAGHPHHRADGLPGDGHAALADPPVRRQGQPAPGRDRRRCGPGHRPDPARHLAEQHHHQTPGHHQRGGWRATARLGRLHEARRRVLSSCAGWATSVWTWCWTRKKAR